MTEQTWILHLCQRDAWEAALAKGSYTAASLETEGFIHFSRPDQMLNVANLFYRQLSDVLILWVNPQKLEAELRWEPVAADFFPHLYGPLNVNAVTAVSPLSPDEDGIYRQLPAPPA